MAAGRRHHHDDSLHARDLRRHDVHQHGRGIGRRAARHIEADGIERRPAPAELDAGRVAETKILGPLPLVEGGDALQREIERRELLLRAFAFGGGDLGGRNGDAGLGEINPVEALRIVDQRLIPAGDHILDDGANRLVDVMGRLPLHGEQRHEALFEIRGGSVQTQGHFCLQPGFPGCQ